MSSEPNLDDIFHLLDNSETEKAIKQLDVLLSLYAKDGNINAIVDILEVLHLNYLEVHPIQWRLRETYKRLGRRMSDDEL